VYAYAGEVRVEGAFHLRAGRIGQGAAATFGSLQAGFEARRGGGGVGRVGFGLDGLFLFFGGAVGALALHGVVVGRGGGAFEDGLHPELLFFAGFFFWLELLFFFAFGALALDAGTYGCRGRVSAVVVFGEALHDLIGHAVGFLFVLVAGLAYGEFGLDEEGLALDAAIALG